MQPRSFQGPKGGADESVSYERSSLSVPVCVALSLSQDPGKGGRKPEPDLLCPPASGALHLCG